MKQENIEALNKLYESLKLLCYQFPNFISDFEIGFIKKSEIEKLIFNQVQAELKICLSNLFNTSDLIFNIINSDDEGEINSLFNSLNADGVL